MEANISKIRLEMQNTFFAKGQGKYSCDKGFLDQVILATTVLYRCHKLLQTRVCYEIVFLDITKYDVTFWNRCSEISEIE